MSSETVKSTSTYKRISYHIQQNLRQVFLSKILPKRLSKCFTQIISTDETRRLEPRYYEIPAFFTDLVIAARENTGRAADVLKNYHFM